MEQEKEFRILRKLVKSVILKEGRILSKNEMSRHLSNLAKKLDETPEDIREILTPLFVEVFEEMISPVFGKSRTPLKRCLTREGGIPGPAFTGRP